jgi:putative iron-dependent peroxidase
MAEPQSGILPEPGESALFLILRLRDRAQSAAFAARAASRLPALTSRLAKRDARARLVGVVGFGPELWDRLSPGARPKAFRPFRAVQAGDRSAPATGGDLFLHLLSRRADLCFELAMQMRRELGDAVEVMDEVHGFRYLDSRDLTGFIDGTENPKGRERAAAALIGAEDPAFAGGSFAFAQRYVHDLAKWQSLPVAEQEQVIGRRKRDSRELSSRAKPPTAHISRTVIEEDGEELEILRHSFPYGTTSECGLFFLAYTRDLGIPEKMLRRMLGAAGDGLHDRLMEFSRAVSGASFFAPSLRVLRSLAAR